MKSTKQLLTMLWNTGISLHLQLTRGTGRRVKGIRFHRYYSGIMVFGRWIKAGGSKGRITMAIIINY